MEKPIRLKSDCIKCMVKSSLENYPDETSELQKIEYMKRVLEAISKMEMHHGAPIVSRIIQDIQKEMFGSVKNYREIKRYFNQLMLEKEEELRDKIVNAEDKIKSAIQYAMTGNYIDFGTNEKVEEKQLMHFFEEANKNHIDEDVYLQLSQDLSSAKKLVYLLDNCGEIVVDKIFISLIKEQYPDLEIVAVVRGGEILNDVTMEDAIQTKLDQMVSVKSNGSNVAGTCYDLISEEAKELIQSADIVISKGQGNFETLQGCGENVYYIFLCKCDMFAKRFAVPKFTGMLIREQR